MSLEVIDGTPTAISKFLRERETKMKKEIKPLSEKIKRVYEDSQLQECYEAGLSAGEFGATEKDNSHFKFFTSPDRTKAWRRGYNLGKKMKGGK